MADLIRSTEIANAQNNPSIGVPLSGAPTPFVPPANPPAGYQQGSQIAQDLSSRLYSGGPVAGMEQNRDALTRQLFAYDQQLDKGSSPFPQTPGYVENPADLYSAAGSFASGLGGVSNKISSGISTNEKAYQDATSSILDKFVNLLTIQENRKQKEAENEYQKKKDERDFLLSIAKITGKNFVDPLTGKSVSVPKEMSATEKASSTLKNSITNDVKSGMTTKDLAAKYAGQADFNDLISIYNANSPYGPAKEGMQDLRSTFELSKTGMGSGETSPAVAAYASRISSGNMKFSDVPAKNKNDVVIAMENMPLTNEDKQNIQGISNQIDDYKKLLSRRFAGIVPLSVDKAKAGVTRSLLGMQIARLYEKGRMSDQDRTFYLSLLPTPEVSAASPDYAIAQLDQVKAQIEAKYADKLGSTQPGGVSDPLGIR